MGNGAKAFVNTLGNLLRLQTGDLTKNREKFLAQIISQVIRQENASSVLNKLISYFYVRQKYLIYFFLGKIDQKQNMNR